MKSLPARLCFAISLVAGISACGHSKASSTNATTASASALSAPSNIPVQGASAGSTISGPSGAATIVTTEVTSPSTGSTTEPTTGGTSVSLARTPAAASTVAAAGTVAPLTPSTAGGSRPTVPIVVPVITNPVTTTQAAAPPMALSKQCDGPRDGAYDLVRMSVQQQQSRYVFAADYTGDATRHDVVVRFSLAGSSFNVDGELFEDGKGVAQLQDIARQDATFLDPVQIIVAGHVELVVPNDLIAGIVGKPFDVAVSLKVDGSPIESC
jgi:hypothetical protein